MTGPARASCESLNNSSADRSFAAQNHIQVGAINAVALREGVRDAAGQALGYLYGYSIARKRRADGRRPRCDQRINGRVSCERAAIPRARVVPMSAEEGRYPSRTDEPDREMLDGHRKLSP
jgi:hypothetical protein